MARIRTLPLGQDGSTVSAFTNPNYNHLVVGCTYYTDSTLETVAEPTTGVINIEGRVNGNSGWSTLNLSPLDCTDDSSYVSTSIPLSEIRAICSGLDAGVFFAVTVTANSH